MHPMTLWKDLCAVSGFPSPTHVFILTHHLVLRYPSWATLDPGDTCYHQKIWNKCAKTMSWFGPHSTIKGATPPAADPWSRGLERKKKGLVVTCSCVGNVCVYFSSDPAMSEADLHVLSGALAFGGTETLGAGAFRGISRSALEVAGLEREEENNNSSSSNNKKNNNNNSNNNNNHKPKRKPNPKLQQEEKDQQQQEQQTTATRKRRGATTTRARTRTRTTTATTTTTTTRTTTTTTTASTSTSTPTTTTRRRKTTFSRTRSPCRWLGSADIYIYINHRITVLPIKNGDFPSFIQLAS